MQDAPAVPSAAATLREIGDFLVGLRRDLPELFAPPPRPAPAPAPVRVRTRDAQRELFAERVGHWSRAMGLSPRRVFLKNQRTLWGSCSTAGNLNFNRALAATPLEVVDYVVIHELAHLREMNHSPRFWAIVSRWCPEHKARRRWLRQNVALLRPSART